MISLERVVSLYELMMRVNEGEADTDIIQWRCTLELAGFGTDMVRISKHMPNCMTVTTYCSSRIFEDIDNHVTDIGLDMAEEKLKTILERKRRKEEQKTWQ